CMSCCLELSEREEDFDTLWFPTMKYSLNKGLNRKSNSCNDGAFVSAGGETFGTSFEHEVSLLCTTKDVKVFKRRFSAINDVIWCMFMSGDDERSVLSVTCGCD
ncbi:hypothetical protein Tco_0041590, partial [Tanacetum coccineum]